MRSSLRLLLLATVPALLAAVPVLLATALALGLARPAAAQGGGGAEDGPAQDDVYVVTYLEALPASAAETRELLAAYAGESRGARGNFQFQALQRIGRSNHFALLEAWESAAAHDAHSRSSSGERFRSRLEPLLYSPPDEREHRGLLVDAAPTAQSVENDGSEAVYVLTHVDVIPPRLEQAVEYLRSLAEASRDEAGNERFDVLVTERSNHMTIVEAWRNTGAQEAHLTAPSNRDFRSAVAPLLGALYDERLYRPLR